MPVQDWFEGPAEELDVGRRGVPFDSEHIREYIRRFRVRPKDNRISALGVCFCPGIPLPWSFYLIGNGIEYDTQALAIRFESEQEHDDDWPNWVVTVTYSTKMPPGGVPELPGDPRGPSSAGRTRSPKGAQTEPELEPPDISWDEDIIRLALPKDLDGKAFLNSAGLPITPAPQFDFAYNTLVVTRSDVGYDPETALEFAMAYNSGTFMNAPPGCVQCMPFRSKLISRGPTFYHRTTYRLRFTPKVEVPNDEFDGPGTHRMTWAEIESKFLNAGVEQAIYFDDVYIGHAPIMGRFFQPVSQPLCLDLDGTKIPPNLLLSGDRQPTYSYFRVREFKDFNRLFTRGLQRSLVGWLTGPAAKYWNLDPVEP